MRNEKNILDLLAEDHCPHEAGLPEYKDCDGEKDCVKCWEDATRDKKVKR